jgi:hypothetical protein
MHFFRQGQPNSVQPALAILLKSADGWGNSDI